jgi:branched-subunit amino acid aminotransferase/4-amino-4-deoxychorismate lyase
MKDVLGVAAWYIAMNLRSSVSAAAAAAAAAASPQANKAGVDEGLMLDPQGFVSTCNSVNFFIVREGEVGDIWCSETGWSKGVRGW